MYLVQDSITGEFLYTSEVSEHMVDYSDNAHVWSEYGVSLTDLPTVKSNLRRIDSLSDWSAKRDKTKEILARWFCTSQENIDTVLSREEQVAIIVSSYQPLIVGDSHQVNGANYFSEFRAGLVYDYRHGTKTDVDIFTIEQNLSGVTAKLISGDWMSARALLSAVSAAGALTQEILDGLSSDFTNYISTHY